MFSQFMDCNISSFFLCRSAEIVITDARLVMGQGHMSVYRVSPHMLITPIYKRVSHAVKAMRGRGPAADVMNRVCVVCTVSTNERRM